MSEIGEALGTASEGGLFAKAVGSEAGGPPANGHFTEGACLNCGTALVGAHCHGCGQKAHLHRTLGAFLHDLLHGALHLDGKIWRTLPLLIFKPGALTRRYIDGERAKFISPMALFLFSVFLMFAVFQAIGLTTPTEFNGQIERPVEMRANLEQALAEATSERDTARAALEAIPLQDPRRAAAEERFESAASALSALEKTSAFALGEDSQLTFNATGISAIDDGLIKKWREHPELMLYKLQANAYKFSWLLIPLSIPFVWLVFAWKRRFKAYDHAIFVTYSIAFVSLLFIALSLLASMGMAGGWIFAALAVIPPIHMYKQLRGTYALSRFSALWRLVFISFSILLILVLFLQVLLLLGAF
ncbi:DUF3667 domain-containing protein [Altererythrobacter sp. BO-6]|uniref:DUF3667 domain-containing protein n=1 Tax=Altererythrobacter sp. BO-6 TaxID=2604537 RepID=UPI0013E134AC|nr:DUF3667 domain-containing protein [Altererythrobacter sp. BO-6]QIG53926.1 DUF3667 domain-containing protein [Altererythrobacter sp. BO-6]